MYSHVIKGSTATHLLLRRLLRTLTGIPGMAIDSVIAIFWIPQYLDYWQDSVIEYADGTGVGFVQGLLGWIGEATGYAIGVPLGAIIGFSAYLADSLISLLRTGQRATYDYFNDLAQFIGRSRLFVNFYRYQTANTYLSKSINIGGVILGWPLIVVPFLAARAVEFYLPVLGNNISNSILMVGSWVGGMVGFMLAIPTDPVLHVIDKTMDLYEQFRSHVRFAVAVLYAKTGTAPAVWHQTGIPDNTMHSADFRWEVDMAGRTSWGALLGGIWGNAGAQMAGRPAPAAVVPLQAAAYPVRVIDHAQVPVDPITQEDLGTEGYRVVVDPCGHSYNDMGSGAGIRFWVSQHHTCPIGRRRLNDADLVPNIAINELLQNSQVLC